MTCARMTCALPSAPPLGAGVEDTLAWPLPGAQAREILAVARATAGADGHVPPHLLTWANLEEWNEALHRLVSKALKDLGVASTTKVTLTGLEVKQAAGNKALSKRGVSSDGPSGRRGGKCSASEGAWGSLVIELPALREGGALSVSHGGETQCFDFSGAAAALTAHWAAWYGVCERQVQPLKSGRMLSLTYSLSCSNGRMPQPPSQAVATHRFEQLERRWVANVRLWDSNREWRSRLKPD